MERKQNGARPDNRTPRLWWAFAVTLVVLLGIVGCPLQPDNPKEPDSNGEDPETPDPFPVEMVIVLGGGAGPEYTFEIGKFEITIGQVVAFLNDADDDAGASEKSTNMHFDDNGGVYMSSELTNPDHDREPRILVATEPLDRSSNITFDSTKPRGSRYGARFGLVDIPVNEISWYGALKFCNWLTIHEGVGSEMRCYTEGPNPEDWHPVVITAEESLTRELTDDERQTLVFEYSGYRLPMDQLSPASRGHTPSPVRPFNEWFKAAAYDPDGPAEERTTADMGTFPIHHWAYGFGRDTITGADANFELSGDPFESDPLKFTAHSTVGFFNGVNRLSDGTLTSDTNNAWSIHDISGNVAEWIQDWHGLSPNDRAVHSGSYDHLSPGVATNYREGRPAFETHSWLGFRVIRVSAME